MDEIKEKRIRKLIFNMVREVEAFLNIELSINIRLERNVFKGMNIEGIIDYSNYEIIYNLDVIEDYLIDEIYISVIRSVRSIYHMMEVSLIDDLSILKYPDSINDIKRYKEEFESDEYKLKDSFSYIDSLSFTKLYMELFKRMVISIDDDISDKVTNRFIILLKMFE